MFDYPTAAELIAAARTQLEQQIVPALADPRLRFQTLIAANVLAIVERELAAGEAQLAMVWQQLAELLEQPAALPPSGMALHAAVASQSQVLCSAIRAGAFDAAARQRELLAYLRQAAQAELAIANPRYLQRIQGLQ